jgi:UDP-glucose 4-epimerase
MRVLVTGGAGFIASHLVDAYLERGDQVLVIDDLSSGSKKNLSSKAELFEISLLDDRVEKIVKNFKPDLINHHAAQKSVRDSVDRPKKDADINIMGLLNLLEAAKKTSCRQVLFASSGGAIYGEQEKFPADEGQVTKPLSPYGISKLASEHYLRFYTESFGFRAVALRYANVYGPRQDPLGEAGVVAIFCSRLLEDRPLTIYGTGEQTRDFVYVADVVKANLLAEKQPSRFLEINIGTQKESSVLDLAKHLTQVSGRNEKIQFEERKPGEQDRSVLDISLAKSVLGWSPEFQFLEGLRQTYQWFQTQKTDHRDH